MNPQFRITKAFRITRHGSVRECKKRKPARIAPIQQLNQKLSPFPHFDPNPPKFLIPDCTWIAPIHRLDPKPSQIKHADFRLNARPNFSQLSKVQNKILRLPPHPISLDLHYAPKNARSTADECQCRSLRLPNLIGHQRQDNYCSSLVKLSCADSWLSHGSRASEC